MNEFANEVMRQRMERTAKALKENNFDVYIEENAAAARKRTEALLNDGDVIGVGGSATLNECDILSLVRSESYKFVDRYESGLDREAVMERLTQSLAVDTFICSSNAVTENGELYNVDGTGNRVAAIAFGPKSVIVIVGCNKIVDNLDDAVKRVKAIAAPANTKRLSVQSYCSETGECMALAKGMCGMTDGCRSDKRICSQYLVSGYQMKKGRIKVILVKEPLGF